MPYIVVLEVNHILGGGDLINMGGCGSSQGRLQQGGKAHYEDEVGFSRDNQMVVVCNRLSRLQIKEGDGDFGALNEPHLVDLLRDEVTHVSNSVDSLV